MRELKSVILKCYLLEISKGSLKVEEEFVCINTCVCTSWEQSSWLRLLSSVQFGQLLSHVQLFVTPETAAHKASLSITNSRSLLKLISIKSVMPSNHLILSSPSSPAFSLSQHQGLFQRVSSLHQVAKVLELQLQHQSFQ